MCIVEDEKKDLSLISMEKLKSWADTCFIIAEAIPRVIILIKLQLHEMIEVHVLGLKFCNGKNHCRKFLTFNKMDNRSRVSSHCIEISSVYGA